MSMPSDFVWGVASAAFQVEGATTKGGRSPSIWDTFAAKPGNVFGGHTGDPACGSYERFEEDAQLIAGLNASAYRFSIAWPRIIPQADGKVNESGLAYYDRFIDALLAKGIEPWATLYHWDMPVWQFDRGGWLDRSVSDRFAEYTRAVVDRLSDRVRHWFTLNEPQVFISHGHLQGNHAPGLNLSRKDALLVTHNALLAHGKSAQVIRAHAKNPPTIGWAPVGELKTPRSESTADIEVARQANFGDDIDRWAYGYPWYCDPVIKGYYPPEMLRAFGSDAPEIKAGDMETIHQPLDFFGVNIYTSDVVHAGDDGKATPSAPEVGSPITMFRWSVRPESLYWGPKFLYERYGLPVMVTENGLASMDWVHSDGCVHDPARIDFLSRYLSQLKRAIQDGTDVRGYFQWSIMDNFEWAEGYSLRFGLVYMDYQTGERIPKDSYHWFSEMAASNGALLPEHISELR